MSPCTKITYDRLRLNLKVISPFCRSGGLLTNFYIAKTDLADIALRSMCTLATEVTHFNFRTNLVTCIVARLSKKSWDEVSHETYSVRAPFHNCLMLGF